MKMLFAAALLLAAACERAPQAHFDRPSRSDDPVVEVQMGTAVSADGTVPENALRDDFRPGGAIFIAARLRGLAGRAMTVNWFGPGGLAAGSTTGNVRDNGTIHFVKTDTKAWTPGDYRVTLRAGTQTLISEQFHIVGSEAVRR